MVVCVAEEFLKTSVTSSSTDLELTSANSFSDVQSTTAASSLADLLKNTQNSSFAELPSFVHLPSVSAVPAKTREDVPVETDTDIGAQRGSLSARERRGEYDLTAAEGSVNCNAQLDQIANEPSSHTVPLDWRLLDDALATYHTGSTPGGGVANRQRSSRWLRSLGSPKLPQPRPPPFKGSGASPISADGSPLLPARGSLEAASRPNTSGSAYVRPHLRPGSQIKRPETSPSAGKRLSGTGRRSQRSSLGAESASGDSSLRTSTPGKLSRRTMLVSAALRKTHTKLRPLCGLYELAGRLGSKAFEISASGLAPCDLARSCRKQSVLVEKLHRQQEHTVAAAQTKTFETVQVEKRLQLLTKHPDCFEGLSMRHGRSGGTHKNDLSSQPSFGAASSSADHAHDRRSAPKQLDDLSTFQAHDLAMSWNLPCGQVTRAWQCFKRYDKDDDGLLSSDEFQMLLRSVLREAFSSAKEIPRSLFTQADEIKSEKRAVTFIDFLLWITQNSFSEDILADDEQRFIRRIARKLDAPVVEIEMVKRHFDSFDTDRSGQIEYDEFYQLLGKLLNLDDMSDLPESRVKSFWREVDDDGSGVIEFSEFAPWYVGYFGGLQGETPLVNFYRKVRPNPFRDFYG